MRKLLLLVYILAASVAPAQAQGFPYDIFKARTLKEVTAITTKAVRPDDTWFFATTLLESKMQVTFTGPISTNASGSQTVRFQLGGRVWAPERIR
jgi:hypothetical protein